MDFIVIDTQSTEWNYMWDWLSNHPLNSDLMDPKEADNNGIKWEYIGSYMQGARIIHELAHQKHPKTQAILKVSVEASKDFKSEHIAKKHKIK